jgi:hypothetical protein
VRATRTFSLVLVGTGLAVGAVAFTLAAPASARTDATVVAVFARTPVPTTGTTRVTLSSPPGTWQANLTLAVAQCSVDPRRPQTMAALYDHCKVLRLGVSANPDGSFGPASFEVSTGQIALSPGARCPVDDELAAVGGSCVLLVSQFPARAVDNFGTVRIPFAGEDEAGIAATTQVPGLTTAPAVTTGATTTAPATPPVTAPPATAGATTSPTSADAVVAATTVVTTAAPTTASPTTAAPTTVPATTVATTVARPTTTVARPTTTVAQPTTTVARTTTTRPATGGTGTGGAGGGAGDAHPDTGATPLQQWLASIAVTLVGAGLVLAFRPPGHVPAHARR